MSRDELVEAYVQGRVTRRVFIRRLVAGGVSLSAAVVYSQLLGSQAPAAQHEGVYPVYPPPVPPNRNRVRRQQTDPAQPVDVDPRLTG
ncbi:MAG TPA: hypothetical protein VM638_04035 [Actinomycetota bacterium]|nr:hypothetical protein [Actinomycetota bacterium]